MGAIYQASAAIADSFVMSGSVWWRSPAFGVTFLPILDIYGPNTADQGWFYIMVGNSFGSEADNNLQIFVRHKLTHPGTIDERRIWSWDRILPQTNAKTYENLWHHLAWGINLNHYGLDDGFGNIADPVVSNFVIDGVALSIAHDDLTGIPNANIEWQTQPNATTGGDPPYPPKPIQINGSGIGIPSLGNAGLVSGYIGPNHTTSDAIEFGDYQVWFDQYIDWTQSQNFAQVVTITGATGRPASYTKASNSLGTPQLLFHGKASDNSFFNNRGTGGAFVKSGTAADFTPSPTYG